MISVIIHIYVYTRVDGVWFVRTQRYDCVDFDKLVYSAACLDWSELRCACVLIGDFRRLRSD